MAEHIRIEKEAAEQPMDAMDDAMGSSRSALAASYNDQIRPLLDAVDRLRLLKVSREGIQLPTIVVVGDQSSGKSSVLESLAGISLPRGQGICTRVPLVMRLQGDPDADEPVLQLEYSSDRVVTTSEDEVGDTIITATAEIAGSGKGISDSPISLLVRKRGVPDLTLVDLPGITRVPVQGQPEDIYDQIAKIIKTYITPKESIILNVLSATVDFPTCESIRMSRQVDPTGERTLAVVTKVDKAPEGLLEKVTMDEVRIGLGYVCVRNRIGEETYDQARAEEERLFAEHPLLSMIDKFMVGIPMLARRLTHIQATIIAKCLPDIVKQINDRLSRSSNELGQMPPDLNNVADAVRELFHIVKQVCTSLEKVLLRAEFDEYPDDRDFHGTARLADMLASYARKLAAQCQARDGELFLVEEMRVLEETKAICLPNFLPRSALLVLLKKKIEAIEHVPHDLVREVWEYVEDLVMRILQQQLNNYPQVQPSCRRAVRSLMDKARARSTQHVNELIEMELVADYTANPDYMKAWADMMEDHDWFLEAVKYPAGMMEGRYDGTPAVKYTVDPDYMKTRAGMMEGRYDGAPAVKFTVDPDYMKTRAGMMEGRYDGAAAAPARQHEYVVNLQGFGDTDVSHLRQHAAENGLVGQAFDLKARLTAYWNCVVLRLVDCLALHVLCSIKRLVQKDLESGLAGDVLGNKMDGVERMLVPSPGTAAKRERLTKSISLLRQSREVIANMMDRINTASSDHALVDRSVTGVRPSAPA